MGELLRSSTRGIRASVKLLFQGPLSIGTSGLFTAMPFCWFDSWRRRAQIRIHSPCRFGHPGLCHFFLDAGERRFVRSFPRSALRHAPMMPGTPMSFQFYLEQYEEVG